MITSMRLERFKNFKEATLDLGPLTVIVGPNASGKSNLRDAFRFVHAMARGYTLADAFGTKVVDGAPQWTGIRGGTREVAFNGSTTFKLTTTVNFFNKGSRVPYRHSIEVDVGTSESPPRVVSEAFTRKNRTIYDSHPAADCPRQEGPEFLTVQAGGGTQRPSGSSVRFLSDRPVLWQFRRSSQVPAAHAKYAERLLSRLASMRFMDVSPRSMREPSFPGQTTLGDYGENLSSVLQAICEDDDRKHTLAEWIRQLTPMDVVDLKFVPDQIGRVLVNLVEADGRETSAYSASDGTLRFLAMLAAILGPSLAKFYFLEEIDNGIHPARLHLLLDFMQQRTAGGKVQIVTTTHSAPLLGMLDDKAREAASLVYRLEGTADGRIRRVMEVPSVREVLKKQNLARLHETGWFENVMEFSRPEDE